MGDGCDANIEELVWSSPPQEPSKQNKNKILGFGKNPIWRQA